MCWSMHFEEDNWGWDGVNWRWEGLRDHTYRQSDEEMDRWERYEGSNSRHPDAVFFNPNVLVRLW